MPDCVRCSLDVIAAADRRRRHATALTDAQDQLLWIDGFNLITSIESSFAGDVILKARNGCYRGMFRIHGSYRRADETLPAVEILGELLARLKVGDCRWMLGKPVSNHGRLKSLLGKVAEERGWNW